VTVSNPDLFSPLVRGYIKKRYKIQGATVDDGDVSLIYIYDTAPSERAVHLHRTVFS
jgi:hypothetical protein